MNQTHCSISRYCRKNMILLSMSLCSYSCYSTIQTYYLQDCNYCLRFYTWWNLESERHCFIIRILQIIVRCYSFTRIPQNVRSVQGEEKRDPSDSWCSISWTTGLDQSYWVYYARFFNRWRQTENWNMSLICNPFPEWIIMEWGILEGMVRSIKNSIEEGAKVEVQLASLV